MKTLMIAAAAGALLATTAEDLQSTYRAGEVRRTEITFESSTDMIEMIVTVDGEEMGGIPDMEQSQTQSRSTTFEDEILRAEDGELLAFDRTYAELGEETAHEFGGPMAEELSGVATMVSDLEGLTVRFTRGDEGFVASFPDDEEGDPDLLEELTDELPWSRLLPEDAVSVDDSWEIDAEGFWLLLNAGGTVHFQPEEMEEGMMMTGEPALDDVDCEGRITATLKALEEIDGVPHAKVSIDVELSTLIDMTEAALARHEEPPDDLPPGMEMPDVSLMELERDYEGEATFLWNLEENRLSSLEIELDLEETSRVEMTMNMGGGEQLMEQESISEGEVSVAVTVEVGEDE